MNLLVREVMYADDVFREQKWRTNEIYRYVLRHGNNPYGIRAGRTRMCIRNRV